MWRQIDSIGMVGSEGGIIIEDEEYEGQCRITRERCEKYDAITCGVYGDMAHTAFSSSEQSKDVYEQMKIDLARFIDSWTDDANRRSEFYGRFTAKY